eukprot:scaffold81933_cov28-Tisochrysis_lutea.AAC.5
MAGEGGGAIAASGGVGSCGRYTYTLHPLTNWQVAQDEGENRIASRGRSTPPLPHPEAPTLTSYVAREGRAERRKAGWGDSGRSQGRGYKLQSRFPKPRAKRDF